MPNYAAAVEAGFVKRGVALRDLADQLGIKVEGLESTIAFVNALAFEEDMDDFGRHFQASQMLLGPYYGVQVNAALLGTEGGLKRTTRADLVAFYLPAGTPRFDAAVAESLHLVCPEVCLCREPIEEHPGLGLFLHPAHIRFVEVQDRSAFRQHEPVSVPIERPRCRLRIVITCAQGPGRTERPQAQR